MAKVFYSTNNDIVANAVDAPSISPGPHHLYALQHPPVTWRQADLKN